MPDYVEYAVVEDVTRLSQDLENSHRCGGYGMPLMSVISSVGFSALTDGSIGAVLLRWLWSGITS